MAFRYEKGFLCLPTYELPKIQWRLFQSHINFVWDVNPICPHCATFVVIDKKRPVSGNESEILYLGIQYVRPHLHGSVCVYIRYNSGRSWPLTR